MDFKRGNIILHVDNLSVAYDEKVIISKVNLLEHDITREGAVQGQIIAVVGRSGRGKSTLFRALTGMVTPASGSVLIPDYSRSPENGIQPAKHVQEGDVGFVDQRYTLFRHKTVMQALLFALRNSNLSTAEKHEKIMSYLVEWGMEKFKDQFPNELSGGQRQRTAIIEQLLSSGHYMVLDEPFSGLDVGNILSVKKSFEIIEKGHELNTLIFSTHDIELAAELADSIYVIGYPKTETGEFEHYGTIVKHFDLKKDGLAWKKEFTADHIEVVNEIKKVMLDS